MAGARLAIDGPSGPLETRTDAEGKFRFADLPAGQYQLRASQEGYAVARSEAVPVRLGRLTSVVVQLSERLEETLVLTREPPPPSIADDPAPGVRGPSEPGVLDPWATPDGVRVSAPPRPPGTVSVPRIAEAVPDSRSAGRLWESRLGDAKTSGLSTNGAEPVLSMVSAGPRGDRRIEADLSTADRSWQGGGDSEADDASSSERRLLDVDTWSLEGGSSAWRDRIWLWAAHRDESLEREAVGGQRVSRDLSLSAFRSSIDAGPSTSVQVDWGRTDSRDDGDGAGPDRAADATRLELEPARRWQLEVSHLVTSSTYALGRFTGLDAALDRLPQGLDDAVLDETGVFRGGDLELRAAEDRRSGWFEVRSSRRSLLGQHELVLGLERAESNLDQSERLDGDGAVLLSAAGIDTDLDLLLLRRSGTERYSRTFDSVWLQDRLQVTRGGDWTFGLGLRLDRQTGRVEGGEAEAHPLFPDLLPAIEEGDEPYADLRFSSLSPRLSVARAFGSERRTILRLGIGSFAERLDESLLDHVAPAIGGELILGVTREGAGRDFDKERIELIDARGIGLGGATVDSTSRLLRPERTDELRVGIERYLARALELRLNYTYRRTTRVLETRRLLEDADGTVRIATAADYALRDTVTGTLPDGTPFAAPVYGLRDGLDFTGGSLLQNGDRERRSESVRLGIVRHLADGWTLRANATYGDWEWRLGSDFLRVDDPTNAAPIGPDPSDDAGAPVTYDADRFVSSRWSFDLLFLYEVARNRSWGFDVAVDVAGREGYPVPWSVLVVSDDRLRDVQALETVDAVRLDDVWTVDLRLAKELRFGPVRATWSVEARNLLGESFVIERETRLERPNAGQVLDTTTPRVVQVGLRLAL